MMKESKYYNVYLKIKKDKEKHIVDEYLKLVEEYHPNSKKALEEIKKRYNICRSTLYNYMHKLHI